MKEIKIPVSELRKFQKRSSHIKGNRIIPIYNYIKFQDGIITKNNAEQFIEQRTEFEGLFFVEELVLNSFIDNTSDTEITFIIGESDVTITDSQTRVKSKSINGKEFIVPPIAEGECTTLGKDVLEAISTASRFTEKSDGHPITPYVFIGNKAVTAMGTFTWYYKPIEIETKQIILTSAASSKIGNMDLVFFYENERYLIFRSEDATYGFIKPTVKFHELSNHFNLPNNAKFTAEKNGIISFNSLCLSISPTTSVADLTMTSDGLVLTMIDEDYGRQNTRLVAASGDIARTFRYHPIHLNRILKVIPDHEITFYEDQKKFYITGDSGFISLIAEII